MTEDKIESMVLATEPCPDCGSNHHRSCNAKKMCSNSEPHGPHTWNGRPMIYCPGISKA
jgi:hypothetical protein